MRDGSPRPSGENPSQRSSRSSDLLLVRILPGSGGRRDRSPITSTVSRRRRRCSLLAALVTCTGSSSCSPVLSSVGGGMRRGDVDSVGSGGRTGTPHPAVPSGTPPSRMGARSHSCSRIRSPGPNGLHPSGNPRPSVGERDRRRLGGRRVYFSSAFTEQRTGRPSWSQPNGFSTDAIRRTQFGWRRGEAYFRVRCWFPGRPSIVSPGPNTMSRVIKRLLKGVQNNTKVARQNRGRR